MTRTNTPDDDRGPWLPGRTWDFAAMTTDARLARVAYGRHLPPLTGQGYRLAGPGLASDPITLATYASALADDLASRRAWSSTPAGSWNEAGALLDLLDDLAGWRWARLGRCEGHNIAGRWTDCPEAAGHDDDR